MRERNAALVKQIFSKFTLWNGLYASDLADQKRFPIDDTCENDRPLLTESAQPSPTPNEIRALHQKTQQLHKASESVNKFLSKTRESSARLKGKDTRHSGKFHDHQATFGKYDLNTRYIKLEKYIVERLLHV
ncbi:MAG: hypothetical protein U0Z75_00875 [Deinococcaceae bacterium]